MVWARKVLTSFLTLILFISLLGAALSTSANSAVAHPQKIETWLNQSNLYQRFISNATQQAISSAGSSEAQGSVTLSGAAVQQAANSAFSNQLFEQSLNTFLNGNYAWLEGKTAQPNFTIDLTDAKQKFASQIGQYVQDHIANLPVCTPQQLAAIGSTSNVDPLNITCRPAGLDPKVEADLVTQKVYNSGGFLSNPVITANTINPKGGDTTEPYYQKLSQAPKIYQAAVKLPEIYAAVAVVCALAVIFLAARKRNGLRLVAGSLITAGVILIVAKFLSDTILKHLETHIFNQTSDGQLQQSLTHFLGLVVSQISKLMLWFGIGYLVLALIILIALRFKRSSRPKPPVAEKPIPAGNSDSIASRLSNVPRQPRPGPTPPPRPPEAEQPPAPQPRPKKKPRLVQ